MNESMKPAEAAWRTVLPVAVIVASVALVAFPRLRLPLVVLPFVAASFANALVLIAGDWRRGLLSQTPRQLLARARAGERFPRHTLGLAAVIASCIAQWQL